jgi:hypothetical protein
MGQSTPLPSLDHIYMDSSVVILLEDGDTIPKTSAVRPYVVLLPTNRIHIDEVYFLGYNAMQSFKSRQSFRRNMLPPSSGLKNKPGKKPALKQVESRARRLCLLPFTFAPPKRRSAFNLLHGIVSQKIDLFNVNSSSPPLEEPQILQNPRKYFFFLKCFNLLSLYMNCNVLNRLTKMIGLQIETD